MVGAAAGPHRVFFEGAQAGRGLAGADDLRPVPRTAATIVAVARRDAAQAAEEIQRHAFRRQGCPAPGPQTCAIAVAGRHRRAVRAFNLELDRADRSARKASRARSRPATTPAWRATSASRRAVPAGTMASVVMSPARPRSSSSAARTSGSIMMAAGERETSCQASGVGLAASSRAAASASASVRRRAHAARARWPENRCGRGRRGFPRRRSAATAIIRPTVAGSRAGFAAAASGASAPIAARRPSPSRSTPAAADRIGATAGRIGAARLQAPRSGRARVGGRAGDVFGDPAGADGGFQQRIAGQAVGAVQAGAGGLAAGPQPGERAAAGRVHGDAAHVVMRRRRTGMGCAPGSMPPRGRRR